MIKAGLKPMSKSILQNAILTERQDFLSLVKDYISLTKPGVLTLLLISTVCPMFVAAGTELDPYLVIWTLIGGALISGSASAINCVYDADIDLIMERTRLRPIPDGRIGKIGALLFALAIGMLGLIVMAVKVNPAAAAIAMFGHFFYVLVYTLWLKRSTPQNIVIGGAAGAVPPVVGWVAVTGEINLTAALMFLFIFLWTPPHFWALAINKNADYTKANVPMMPVICGVRNTSIQMLAYAISLVPVSVLLVLADDRLSWFSLIFLLAMSLVFVEKNYRVYNRATLLVDKVDEKLHKMSWEAFGYSIAYLGLFFLCLVIDSTLI